MKFLSFFAAFTLVAMSAAPVSASTLSAAVWEHAPSFAYRATGSIRAMKSAGFEVMALDQERSPLELGVDVLVFGSFVSADPAYRVYMDRFADDVRKFVERGGVVLQMTQADQHEISPPYLPETLELRRGDPDLQKLYVLAPDHMLTRAFHPQRIEGSTMPGGGFEIDMPEHLGRRPNWETLTHQDGFCILIASQPYGDDPALVEAAHGKGRFIHTSMFFDLLDVPGERVTTPEVYRNVAATFFAAFHAYVTQVAQGSAPEVVPTTPPAPLAFVEGSWTIAVLPDTQNYRPDYRPGNDTTALFAAQTKWLVEQKEALRIHYVLHLGDIVSNNTHEQWTIARDAMNRLDGHIPYAIVGGNHDYGPNGNATTRDTLMNDYFPLSKFTGWPTFGGVMETGKTDNSYHLFEVDGDKWIVLTLEWGPREEVLAWANEVMDKHPDRKAILVTHAYMYYDETRYDWQRYGKSQNWSPYAYGTSILPGGVNDGEDMWNKLVKRHPGFRMTLNGHVLGDGVALLTSEGEHGNHVHQMLINFQMRDNGGDGYLRLFEFLPDGRRVQVRTYSPTRDEYLTQPPHQFVFDLSTGEVQLKP